MAWFSLPQHGGSPHPKYFVKGILEERILDAKIEFTLREALGIAKKDPR
jgi:hypothetical protein